MSRPIWLLVFLVGCASTEGYRKKLDGWVGRPTSEVVAEWGVPRSSIQLQDGTTAMEYVDITYSGNICRTTFVAGQDAKVRSTSAKGACYAR